MYFVICQVILPFFYCFFITFSAYAKKLEIFSIFSLIFAPPTAFRKEVAHNNGMPAFFTHEIVCERTLKKLSPELVRTIDRSPYRLGAQGGDPLFFCRIKRRRVGVLLHRKNVYAFFNALLQFENLSFPLGYLTHYATDTVFHPYVYRTVREKGSAFPKHNLHAMLERDIDRLLRDRLQTFNGNPTKPSKKTLKTLYADLAPVLLSVHGVFMRYEKFALAYRAYFFFQKLLQERGDALRPVVSGAERFLFHRHVLSDFIPRNTRERSLFDRQDFSVQVVYDLAEKSVRKSVCLIEQFLFARKNGTPLPEKSFSEDFNKGKDA